MAGPGESAGRPGEQDGRLDVFLERGEYKAPHRGPSARQRRGRLGVPAFTELSGQDRRCWSSRSSSRPTLDDFQQRSYWIKMNEPRRVVLEAAGRNLADLRLWRDGQWLVDATPAIERLQPKVGRPLLACRLATELEPGLYLVTAYGGPAQPWAEESDAHPFYMRFGLPRLPEAGRRRFAVSPFGIDRYLVPGRANYFRLELPEAVPATLRAGDLDPSNRSRLPGNGERSRRRACPRSRSWTFRTRTCRALDQRTRPPPTASSPSRARPARPTCSSSSTAAASTRSAPTAPTASRRSIPAIRRTPWTRPRCSCAAATRQPLRDDVVELDAKTAWTRRANLLAPLTVFLRVKDAGRYEVLLEGPEARARIEPFFTWRPHATKPRRFAAAAASGTSTPASTS